MSMVFIHIPKTAGTSVRDILCGPANVPHKRLKDYDEALEETLTIARNPFDRAVDIYWHLARDMATPQGFQHWVIEGLPSPIINKYGAKLADPAVTYVEDFSVIDHILRFEHIEEDFKALTGKDLLHKNPSPPMKYKEFYDGCTVEAVTKYYQADIDQLGYAY